MIAKQMETHLSSVLIPNLPKAVQPISYNYSAEDQMSETIEIRTDDGRTIASELERMEASSLARSMLTRRACEPFV